MKTIIVTTAIAHPKNPLYQLIPGPSTKDQVLLFLAGCDAEERYAYAVEKGWIKEQI